MSCDVLQVSVLNTFLTYVIFNLQWIYWDITYQSLGRSVLFLTAIPVLLTIIQPLHGAHTLKSVIVSDATEYHARGHDLHLCHAPARLRHSQQKSLGAAKDNGHILGHMYIPGLHCLICLISVGAASSSSKAPMSRAYHGCEKPR